MIEQAIEIRTADGVVDGFIYRNEDGQQRPGVLHLTDIAGIRQSHRDMARRLAETGYVVLLPNVFYRTARPPVMDFTPSVGDERTMKRMAELTGPLTVQAIERDVSAYVDFLAAQDSVGQGPMGVVGYCYTGGVSLRTAAARPDKIAAAASFHGGGLFTDAPSSPHTVLPRVKARLYFGHATNDASMPAQAIEKLEGALNAWGGQYESEIYAGAMHGWTVPGGPAYNQPQAERAFEKLTALFAQAIRQR